MAKLPSLVDAIQKVDGRERKTIDWIARSLRDAGLIPAGKRGVGAPEVDLRAAANLLIGLMTNLPAKEIPAEVEAIRNVAFTVDYGDRPELLPCKELFGEQLEAVLDATPALMLLNVASTPAPELMNFAKPIELRVSLTGQIAVFKVLDGLRNNEIWRAVYSFGAHHETSDRRVTVEIGLETLLALYHVILPHGETS